MKRSGPPKRKTPLESKSRLQSGGELKRTPIKRRSAKREALYAEHRRPLIQSLNDRGVGCLICPLLREAGLATRCGGGIEGMHERRKRSAGGSLVNPANLIPACNWSNGWIEDNPAEARDLFGTALVVREGDPEYEALGAREDSR